MARLSVTKLEIGLSCHAHRNLKNRLFFSLPEWKSNACSSPIKLVELHPSVSPLEGANDRLSGTRGSKAHLPVRVLENK